MEWVVVSAKEGSQPKGVKRKERGRKLRSFMYIGKVPVAARSKAWLCGHLLIGIMGSNPAGTWMSLFCEC
jgi:hypothetical protein